MKTLLEEINDITWWNEINKLKNILKRLISSFISDAPINGNPFVRQDGEWVEQTAGSGIESITGDFVDNSDPLNPIIEDPRPYKVYTAWITQTGTNAPTATVLENTLGQEIIWSYNGTGSFTTNDIIGGTSENLWVTISKKSGGKDVEAEEHNTGGASAIYLSQTSFLGGAANGIEKGYIEIRLYN